MCTGYLIGAFDLLNVRDLDIIDQARDRAGRVVLAILDDAEVERLYGRPPVVPLLERVMLAAHIRGIHQVVVHGTDEAERAQRVASVRLAVSGEPTPDHDLALITPRRETCAEQVRIATGTLALSLSDAVA